MRGVFMIVSLLIALAIVGVLAKKQLASMPGRVVPSADATSTSPSTSAPTAPPIPALTPSAQKDAVQQFKQALEAAQPVKRETDEK